MTIIFDHFHYFFVHVAILFCWINCEYYTFGLLARINRLEDILEWNLVDKTVSTSDAVKCPLYRGNTFSFCNKGFHFEFMQPEDRGMLRILIKIGFDLEKRIPELFLPSFNYC